MDAPVVIIPDRRVVTLLRVGREGTNVVVRLNDIGIAMPWKHADEVAMRVKRAAATIAEPQTVLLRLGGHEFILARKLAAALWEALVIKARDAEEQAKAPAIAFDQAILMRSNAPFGFSSDPKIRDEAAKEAAHNRDLRRFAPAPKSIKSKESFGRPSVMAERRTLDERVHELPAEARDHIRIILGGSP